LDLKNNIGKIKSLLNKKQKYSLVVLIILLFFGMVLEVFGLGVLLPIISILIDKNIQNDKFHINEIKSYFDYLPENEFLFFALLFLVIVYTIKSFFLIYLTYKQNRFLSNITAFISESLFSRYLYQPYSFFLNDNVSRLSKNIQVEVNYFSIFLKSLIILFVEGGLVLSILLTLIIIEPIGAITLGLLFSILSLLFNLLTKNKLKYYGTLRQELDSKTSKIVLETFEGIKTVMVKNLSNYYSKEFNKISYQKARVNSNQLTLSMLPRYYFELVSIFCLVGFIILLTSIGKDSSSLLATLSIFVAAVFRVIPSLNRIIASLQSTKFYNSSVNIIHNELNSLKNSKDEIENKLNFNNRITIQNLDFKYNDKYVLKNISLEIKKNETIGIIGESGSGKSTLVDLIIGIHNPSKGEVSVDGKNILFSKNSWFSKIGYVNQDVFLTDDSIKNNITLGDSYDQISEEKINKAIEQSELGKFINGLKEGIQTKVGDKGIQLSGGQKQRLGIARALYRNPEVLIFDEATSALDLKTESRILSTIKNLQKNKTIIIVSHRPSSLNFCDKIYEIKNTKCNKINGDV